MNAWPTVSVVVPTHNRFELLTRALKSIIGQTYPGLIECLVVFDASDVRHVHVETGERRRIRYLVNDRTPGPAGARNTGALAATGDLVSFCDDDDEWFPNKLDLQVRAVQRDERSEVVACGVVVQFGRRTSVRLPGDKITLPQLLRSRMMQAHLSTILVRRLIFVDEIGPIDETYPGSYAEDYDWMLRAASRTSIATVPEPLVIRHWHDSFFATRWELMAQALQTLLDKHPELEQDHRGLARIYGRMAFATAASREGNPLPLVRRTIALDPRQVRAYLAVLVWARLVRPDTLLWATRAFGHGI